MSKFHVNKEVCIGCGTCISTCPECFEFDEEGKSQVKTEETECNCDAHEIIDDCPVRAISLEG
ncbi:MAG: ferredoxin [Patescibacteria group bacterium]|nr:ferredoxin [Patescibacteria group bacterium]